MAKKHRKKNSGRKFLLGMVIYAVVFLVIAAFGLNWFWSFMEAYELSRPQGAIDAYMEKVDKEYVVDQAAELIAQVDHNIQSEEACRQVILNALTEEITYARKASACTETRQVYVLRSGSQVVGSFAITAGEEDQYGFRAWDLSKESYDLSFLLGSTVSAEAPEGYPVYVNGVQLDSSYVTSEESREYEVLEEFYDDFELPSFVTYTYEAGPFLGDFPMEVTDPEGNPFVMDESFDYNTLVNNCSAEEVAELEDFVEEFLEVYVLFAGCANDDRYNNYNKVVKYVVPDSNLQQRMYDAIDGMQFAQSRGDEIASIEIHHNVKIEEGRYMCDVTFLVDTTGREGVVQTTNNAKILIVETNGKLLVEGMTSY